MNTYRVWMRDGSAGLYNAETAYDAEEQAIMWAMEAAYEAEPDSALFAAEQVIIDKVELLCTAE